MEYVERIIAFFPLRSPLETKNSAAPYTSGERCLLLEIDDFVMLNKRQLLTSSSSSSSGGKEINHAKGRDGGGGGALSI